ncbi:MAG: selenide, water dikinase SelD, partial [Actinobacteria bacterium RBG_19FT_COMBO_54_7]
MGPEDLEKVLRLLPLDESREEILVGLETPDDAGIFLLDHKLGLVQTVDFFTPIVDDPFRFGQIASANALSDIYAMGGTPLTAMNIVCFPCTLGMDMLAKILQGGLEKIREAGATLLGGHTVDDEEPKYGLAVTGRVDPDKILKSLGAVPGDLLVLTKPLGTGILSTALKGDFIAEADMDAAVAGMAELNRDASRSALAAGARACTDVTGFGLAGHIMNMLPEHGLACRVYPERLPLYPRTREMADQGMLPAGAFKNRDFLTGSMAFGNKIETFYMDILFDPQTSGGLLIALAPDALDAFYKELGRSEQPEVIGEFFESSARLIEV